MSDPAVTRTDPLRGKGIAALAVCAFLWSTAGLFIKIVAWNPVAIAGVRSLIGGLVILVWLRRPHFTWSRTQILCALSYAACMVAFVIANKLTTAANAILLQYTAPVYAAFLGAMILGERTSWLDWLTIGIVLGGMVLFFVDKLSLGNIGGNLLAVASGVFFAIAIVLLRKQKDGSSLESILLSHVITFGVSIPFIFLAGAPSEPKAWLGIAFLGVFQIGIPSFLIAYGTKHVSALQSLLTSIIEPIFNPLWVFLIVGEKPGPLALVGGAIILVTITTRSVVTILPRRTAGRP